MAEKEISVRKLMDKARSGVRLFQKSSIATRKLLEQCNLVLIKDCPTCWSSTYNMITRHRQLKDSVCQIANEMRWDCLIPSEWQKLVSLRDLLLPFAEHNEALQSDTMSMSLVLPAVLDLLRHLSDFEVVASHYRDLDSPAQEMTGNMNQRFAWLLDPTSDTFSPLAVAANFVNPTQYETLASAVDDSIQELLIQAEEYLVKSHEDQHEDEPEEEDEEDEEAGASSLRQPVFRFLSKCCCRTNPRQRSSTTSMRQQICKYKEDVEELSELDDDRFTAIDIWLAKSDTFCCWLKPFALDLLAVSASQAFAEKVFSVSGDLTSGKCNRARLTLVQGAFLKMNRPKRRAIEH